VRGTTDGSWVYGLLAPQSCPPHGSNDSYLC
jgi:hypothetical protein